MGHNHHHHHPEDLTARRLAWAVVINVALTAVQIAGGVLSGSLALIADGLHNLSDAGSLVIAYVARKIAGLPPSSKMTFGYRRAEILGALINSVILLTVGCYLIWEAASRIFNPTEIDAWVVIYIASFALIVDVATALLTLKGSRESLNIKAAFVHNMSDALASAMVILSGFVILFFQVYWVDWVATFLISGYVIYHGATLVRQTVLILMQSAPNNLTTSEIKSALEKLPDIQGTHHIHLWQLDEHRTFFEAHLVISETSLREIERIKKDVRSLLKSHFDIHHSTLEIEIAPGCQ